MRRSLGVLLLLSALPAYGQAQLTLDWPAMAERIVRQLDPKPGEKVLSLSHPWVEAGKLKPR